MAKIWIVIFLVASAECLAAQEGAAERSGTDVLELPAVSLGLTPRFYYDAINRKAGIPDSLVYRDFQMAPRLQAGFRYSGRGYVHLFADVLYRSVDNDLVGESYFTLGFGAMAHWAFRDVLIKSKGRGRIRCYPNFYVGAGFSRLGQGRLDPYPEVGTAFKPYFNIGNGLHFFVTKRIGIELAYMIEFQPAIYWQPVRYLPFQTKIVYSL